ncbi:MAG: integral rane sensor signal transduction histidine kinase [Fibrobacteres bacterium]|nr:integral rane sensor signal transduction histidine kinase [Fibrobacterota bacterium]
MKLRTRLFLGFFLLSGAGFYFLVNRILDDLRPRYLESSEVGLIDTSNLLAALLESDLSRNGIPVQSLREAFRKMPERIISAKVRDIVKTGMDLRVYVTDSAGMVVFDSDGGRDEGKDYSRWNDVYRTLRGQYGARSTRTDPEKPSTSFMYVGAPIRKPGSQRVAGVVTVSKPSNSIDLFISAARGKIVAGGLVAAFAVALLGMVVSALILRPIQRLTDYARAIRDGRPAPLPALGRSEIGEMGRAFEEMREALEGRKYVEQYVHTLTHELKSPMSSVRGAAELLQEDMPREKRAGFLANIRSEIDRMQSLVDRMLDLSGLESRRGLEESQRVELSGLAMEVRDRLGAPLVRKEIDLHASLESGLWVLGEKFLLQQAFQNLLDNAIAFSPKGGRLDIRAGRVGGLIQLEVLDQGPGIPGYAREKVFGKFFSLQRPDTGRKSSGLGLTIVHEITRLHQGTIRLEARPEGGLRAVWSLPASISLN